MSTDAHLPNRRYALSDILAALTHALDFAGLQAWVHTDDPAVHPSRYPADVKPIGEPADPAAHRCAA